MFIILITLISSSSFLLTSTINHNNIVKEGLTGHNSMDTTLSLWIIYKRGEGVLAGSDFWLPEKSCRIPMVYCIGKKNTKKFLSKFSTTTGIPVPGKLSRLNFFQVAKFKARNFFQTPLWPFQNGKKTVPLSWRHMASGTHIIITGPY